METCSTCKHLRTLFAHPSNNNFGKGEILESIGFVYLNPEVLEDKGSVYFESDNGVCECYAENK